MLLITLLMTLLLASLLKQRWKPNHQFAIKSHTFLFGICCFIVFAMLLNNAKAASNEWQKRDASAFAKELPAPELEPVFPLVEQIQLRPSVRLDAPVIGQHPELPRGCEVTSLAMLLQYFAVDVDKMELAEKVAKDDTPYKKTADGVYFGNPHKGFVGDMYSFSNPGLGVYHEPIADLARLYVGEKVKDFSGGSFYQILQHLNQNRPVWVITNASYKKLPKQQFQTWQTDDGPIRITMREHSVLVTGYDDEFIYFNDPLRADIRKAPMEGFREAWEQMGKQAITVVTP